MSSNDYKKYYDGDEWPKTAEELLRARYHAIEIGRIDFITKSHHPDTLHEYSESETKQWAKESEWGALNIKKIIDGKENDDSGEIEFSADYKIDGEGQVHRELSQFVKKNNKWFFYGGKVVLDPYKRTAPKLGRNDPCSCGSGKKFKKCCGK